MHSLARLAFALLAASTLPAPAIAQGAISAGETKRGVFVTGQTKAADNSYYDDWTFRGSAGQRVVITMRSDAFDAYLALGRGTGSSFQSLTDNDDKPGARTRDAEIDYVLPATGEFTIRANSLTAEQTGAYSLSLWMTGAGTSVTQSGSPSQSTGEYLNPIFSELMRYADGEGTTFKFMIVGQAPKGESTQAMTLRVTAGTTYTVRGACDKDCTDLDLTVRDENGKTIASDSATDDHPTVTFTSSVAGSVKVTTTMATCSTRFCFFGVVATSR